MSLREGQRRSRISRLRKSIAIIVKERSANYFIIAFILFSSLFQLIAFVTSGWLVVDIRANNLKLEGPLDLELGLIYVQYCKNGVCKTDTLDNFNHEDFGMFLVLKLCCLPAWLCKKLLTCIFLPALDEWLPICNGRIVQMNKCIFLTLFND